ncbi:MAG: HD domain-containing protein [Lachnospiraceae bacterium]|nr:HD domain-containing protein [Lachnospiraceae bacterium]
MYKHRESNKALYFICLGLYLFALVFVTRMARSQDVISVFGTGIPASALTGVLSSLANICIIFMVVFCRKPGFITALILLLLQFPMMLQGILVQHSLTSVPGMFMNILTIVTAIAIYRRNKKIEDYQKIEVDYLMGQQKASRRLFEQTATALVNAIDAKDTYSHGHSLRVAEYSKMIARMLGKDEEECQKIYYAALLHDVGKIGIPNNIINKKGKLTVEEYEIIKQHPVKGNAILSSISEYPYLSIGSHYHHERYDGKGYPDKLKGEDIPEIARIISVADAYDAMSSNRSYRNAIPQQLVREEIVKGAGTQFDPEIAKIMQHLIDQDPDYKMQEKDTVSEFAGKNEITFGDYRSEISDGIIITQYKTQIRMRVHMEEEEGKAAGTEIAGVSLILFDSLDGRVHDDEKTVRELCYFEYGEVYLDGRSVLAGARKMEANVTVHEQVQTDQESAALLQDIKTDPVYEIVAVKVKDHILIRIDDGEKMTEVTVALPDSSRYAYIALTGTRCRISDVSIRKESEPVPDTFITRIAEEISYIDGNVGDIPNLQVDGQRTAATDGIRLLDHLVIGFHTMSLPTARLVWHCPYFVIFSSSDGKVGGSGYREYALIRLDGENSVADTDAKNILTVSKQDDFPGWDAWKETHKKGLDCVASFVRIDDTITMNTENLGISTRNTTTIPNAPKNIYVALTGDQCALTDIRIER